MKNVLGKINWINVIIILALAVIASLPFLQFDESLPGMDLFFHQGRIENIANAIKFRQEFPIRSDLFFYNGYGSAEAIMYPGLFMYIPGLIYMFSDNMTLAYNLMYFFINLGFSISMYYATKKLTGDKNIAIVSTIIAVLLPYRIFTLYIRAAIGELIAQIFIPILILGFYELIYRDYRKWYILVIAVTGILESHMITLIHAFVILLILFVLRLPTIFKESKNNKNRLLSIVKFAIFTLAINLWFIVPFLSYFGKGLLMPICATPIINSTCSMLDYFKFYMANGYTFSFALIVFFVLTIIYLIKCLFQKIKPNALFLTLFILSLIFIIMASSVFPWQMIDSMELGKKYIAIIQFAYRYLGFATITLSMSTVYFSYQLISIYNTKKAFYALITLLVLISSFFSYYIHLNFVLTNEEDPERGYYIEYVFYSHNNSFFSGDMIEGKDYVDLPVNYFEYYKAFDGENYYDIEESKDHLVRVNIKENDNIDKSLLEVRVKEPISWRISELISFIALIVFIVSMIKQINLIKKEDLLNSNKHYVNGFMIRNYVIGK